MLIIVEMKTINNFVICNKSESEYFTGDTSTDIHSPGPTIAKTSL